MEVPKKFSFIKALCALCIQTLIPTILIWGLTLWIYFLSVVSFESNNSALILLSIATFIVVAFAVIFLAIFICEGVFGNIFISSSETKYIVTPLGNDTFKIEKSNNSDNGWGLAFILAILVAIIGIPLFIIGFIRLIISENFRLNYVSKLYDFYDTFIEYKTKIIIGGLIITPFFVGITTFGLHVQQKHNIDIFLNFRKPPEKVYIAPTLRATNMEIYRGGSYINGYVVELTTVFEYTGEGHISSLDGEITIYSPYNNLLLTADCTFSQIENLSTKYLSISCRNTSEIQELSSYNLQQVSIYFKLNNVLYDGFTTRRYDNTSKIN